MLKKLMKKAMPCVLSVAMVVSVMSQMEMGMTDAFSTGIWSEKVWASEENVPVFQKCSLNDDGSISLEWDNAGATSYVVSRAKSRFGNYVQIGTTQSNSYKDTEPNAGKYNNYYKVQAVNEETLSDFSEPTSLEIDMFGQNMYVFQDTDDTASVNTTIADIFDKQHYSQFGENRYAYAFKPGDYTDLDIINIGYYTSIYGLGGTPHPVRLNNVKTPAALDNNNATCNFWVSIENVTIADLENNGDVWYSFQWGVSQAAPARRLLVERTASFDWFWGWASGGYVADSYFAKSAGSWSQQQYYYRNCYVNDGTYGVNWNLVIQGCEGNTVDTSGYTSLTNNNGITNWESSRGSTTVINNTEKIREKPFLYFDSDADEYKVFVPSMRKNAEGISWGYNDMGAGTSISLDKFYVARSDRDSAKTINEKLAAGYNIIFAPGVFYVEEPIEVTNPNTIVLGLGLASIVPMNSEAGMKISDVSGITVAGVIFDAGTYSETLLTVGDEGCNKEHAENPIMLQDIFYRVGGTGKVGTTKSCLVINSNDTIVDHTWIWRADHGDNTGWYSNTADNGLVVNGDDIICYGLFVEHFQKYDILWRGENGKTYFLQNEKCYDPQKQDEWMSHDGQVLGYSAYKVANNVKQHYAVGLGVYDVFIQTNGADIFLENAVEVPDTPGVLIENLCTVEIASGVGPLVGINHMVNGTGPSIYTGTESGGGYAVQRLLKYSNNVSKSLQSYYENSGSTEVVNQQGIEPTDDVWAEKIIIKDEPSSDNEPYAWTMTDASYQNRIDEIASKQDSEKEGSIEILGVQISANNYGMRVITAVDNKIQGKDVVAYGNIYGVEEYGVTEEDLYIGSTNKYVFAYTATSNAVISNVNSSADVNYAMTMLQGSYSEMALTMKYCVKSFAKLSDGTYVYSDTMKYSVYDVAEELYRISGMRNETAHNYLYDKIITVVNKDYAKIAYIY